MDEILPLDMTYTLQKSGAPFDTIPGISAALNLQRQTFLKLNELPHKFMRHCK